MNKFFFEFELKTSTNRNYLQDNFVTQDGSSTFFKESALISTDYLQKTNH